MHGTPPPSLGNYHQPVVFEMEKVVLTHLASVDVTVISESVGSYIVYTMGDGTQPLPTCGMAETCDPDVTDDDNSLYCTDDDLKDGNYGATQLTPMKSGDDDDDDDDEGGPITDAIATGLASTSSAIDTLLCCGDTEDEEADLEKDEKAAKDIIVVAFLGSMDDFMARGLSVSDACEQQKNKNNQRRTSHAAAKRGCNETTTSTGDE